MYMADFSVLLSKPALSLSGSGMLFLLGNTENPRKQLTAGSSHRNYDISTDSSELAVEELTLCLRAEGFDSVLRSKA